MCVCYVYKCVAMCVSPPSRQISALRHCVRSFPECTHLPSLCIRSSLCLNFVCLANGRLYLILINLSETLRLGKLFVSIKWWLYISINLQSCDFDFAFLSNERLLFCHIKYIRQECNRKPGNLLELPPGRIMISVLFFV